MKIPRFWAKDQESVTVSNPETGAVMDFACWGWSDTSKSEAENRARERTKAVAAKVGQGRPPEKYLYSDQPLREEIMDEWKSADGSTYAAITRNSYGCQVLNTTNIMFVDVDLPETSSSSGMLGKLFGKKGPDPREVKEAEAIGKVRDMIRMDSRAGVRIYRTRGGLRYLLTHSRTDPRAEPTIRAMQVLGADPLYVTLCRVQECFRARLTPKPWRCGVPLLRTGYPWADKESERIARSWIQQYSKESDSFATCLLVEHFGSKAMDSEIARVVEYHDQMTKAGSGLDLA